MRPLLALSLVLSTLAHAGESPENLIAKLTAAKEADRPPIARELIEQGVAAAPALQKALKKTTDARVYATLAFALSRLDTQVSDETLQSILGRTPGKDLAAEFVILEAADRMFPGQADRDSVFEETAPVDKSRCVVDKKRFEVVLTKPKTESVGLTWIRAETLLPVGFETGRFDHHPAFVEKSAASVCDKTQALKLRDNLVAILLQDGDQLAAIWFNPVDRKVIASRSGLGAPGKMETKGEDLIVELPVTPECEGDKCPKVEGRQPTRILPPPAWHRIAVGKDPEPFEKPGHRIAEFADGKKCEEQAKKQWLCK